MGKRSTIAPVRLWVKGNFTGYRKNKRTEKPGQALVTIQGVNDKAST